MNPAIQKYLKGLLADSSNDYYFDGGHEKAERKVLVFGQIYEDPFKILFFENIDESINHRDVLGSIISLNIDRDKIGDIVFNGSRLEIAISTGVAKNVLYNLKNIKNFPVQGKVKSENILQASSVVDEDFTGSIASLRLDCMIAEMAKTSRSKAQDLIQQGKIKINHIEERDNSINVDEGDIISISKIGRFVVGECKGRSRKNRIFINYIKKG